MRLVPSMNWTFDSEPVEEVDPRLLPLLESIASADSLAAAVAERGNSYRAAWGLLRDYEQRACARGFRAG